MPIKIRYNKQAYEVSEWLKTIDQVIVALAATNIVEVCPKFFQL
jgi:hypothetical protein